MYVYSVFNNIYYKTNIYYKIWIKKSLIFKVKSFNTFYFLKPKSCN